MDRKLGSISTGTLIICLLVALTPNYTYGQNFAQTTLPERTAEELNRTNPGQQLPVMGQDTAVTDPEAAAIRDLMNLESYSHYTLGITDVIQIDVARHPEVSGKYVINHEGKIQYGFVGDIVIEGLTKEEVKTKLGEVLSDYIINPEILVQIVGYNSKVIYVIGEVGRPGKIYMQGDTMTVREALMQAGLPQLTASTRKCRLFTPSEKGDAAIKHVNVFSLLYEGDLRENFVMSPGDTLYIPATVMAKTMRVLSPVTQPIGAGAGTARTVTTGF